MQVITARPHFQVIQLFPNEHIPREKTSYIPFGRKTENFRQFQKASEGVFRGRRYNGTLSKKIPRIKL